VAVFSVGLPWVVILPVEVAAMVFLVGVSGGWSWVAVGTAAIVGFALDVWAGRWVVRRRVGNSGSGGR